MTQKDKRLKALLDVEVCERNSECELSYERPDPLLVASRYRDEYAILLCALYGYGNAKLIVKFLDSLDFSLLDANEEQITKALTHHYYRFQNPKDVIESFITFRRMKQEFSLQDLFVKAYAKEHSVLEGIDALIETIHTYCKSDSYGFNFLMGKAMKRDKQGFIKHSGNAPYKRWMMYLRWMVREDSLDMGLWQKVSSKDLILPLDTHTFNVSKKLGLLNRKTYDLKSAIEITNKLKSFDNDDPIKYDFALYRIGQENIL